jgi:hypothetical protein
MSLKILTQRTIQLITKLQDVPLSKTKDKVLGYLNFSPESSRKRL